MKNFIYPIFNFIFCSALCFGSHQIILYDWSGQFGYVKDKGLIFWGKDWRSKNLLFDGAWAIFPQMYGDNIMQGFLADPQDNQTIDSLNILSYLNYDQGDYGLDRFSFGLENFSKNKNFKIEAFKRSFLGNHNQYYYSTYQPLQQSYIISYETNDSLDHSGLSIGHFNTYSGFPDKQKITNGLYDNKITSLNYFWKKKIGQIFYEFSLDQFLQRYKAIHTLSIYEGSRFLNRSQYKIAGTYLNDGNLVSFGINTNNRNIIFDTKFNSVWHEIISKIDRSPFYIFLSIIKNKKDYFFNYNISFTKKLNSIKLQLSNLSQYTPTHPYYFFKDSSKVTPEFFQKSRNNALLKWDGIKNDISVEVSFTKDKQNFLGSHIQDSLLMKNQYLNMELSYERILISNFHLLLKYNINQTNNYYSGGIGKKISVEFNSYFSLFDKYMKIELRTQFNHLFDRVNHSLINPIEMVPIIYQSNDFTELDNPMPITLINGSINAKVSSFTIGFKWINITEIILSSLGSDRDNHLTFHPEMPEMGRQINLLLSWSFQD
ncbi:MAG: hypothetical protein CMG55_10670 [Candidatus Marinimicrobia bacterium]|nr:hypothetical protein [Candidatus Neomarinimicrobiota bacterium]